MRVYTRIDSPLGELLLVGEKSATAAGGTALVSVSTRYSKGSPAVRAGWEHDLEAFTKIATQLAEYFSGGRTSFDIDHVTTGTDFQQRVWKALETIPYGTTTTYGRIAEQIGAPRGAVRAVGAAIGQNPLLVVRPCHRVIGANGSLTGFAAGLDCKRQLLQLEGVTLIA